MKRRLLIGAMMLILGVLMMNLAGMYQNSRLEWNAEQTTEVIFEEARIINPDMAKKVALTFDDGPHPYYTEEILNYLSKEEVNASFFVLGKFAKEYPDIVKRMYEEGHLVGNHTFSHIQYTTDDRVVFLQEVMQTNQILQDITGKKPEFIRPPYGCFDKEIEEECEMIPILWTIDPRDWCCECSAFQIAENVVTKVEDGDIILMHDYYDTTVEAVKLLVPKLKAEGYEFVTVDEMILD